MKKKHPFLPYITLEQILGYQPDNAETHTSSALINAVCEALANTRSTEVKEVAEYLDVDARKLSSAVQIITGLTMHDILQQYILKAIHECVAKHPDWTLDQVADHLGYSCRSSVWRFTQRIIGVTPLGTKSHAGPERYNEMRRRKNR